jgi:hypothetical protein
VRLIPSIFGSQDEDLKVIYLNEKCDRSQWHTFEVGKTRFSDTALRKAGEMTIFHMREKKPAYNLIDNNCQQFAVKLLDFIQIGKHKEFATVYEVYQKAVGPGTVASLFKAEAEDHPDDKEDQRPETPEQGTPQLAMQVMDENTTKLDNHHSLFHEA